MNRLSNVEIVFDNSREPDKFGKFSLMVKLTGEQSAELEDAGINVKMFNDSPHYSFTKATVSRKGTPNAPMLVRDNFGKEFLGSASRRFADISWEQYKWSVNGKEGIKARLLGVKVLAEEGGLEFDTAPADESDPFA